MSCNVDAFVGFLIATGSMGLQVVCAPCAAKAKATEPEPKRSEYCRGEDSYRRHAVTRDCVSWEREQHEQGRVLGEVLPVEGDALRFIKLHVVVSFLVVVGKRFLDLFFRGLHPF